MLEEELADPVAWATKYEAAKSEARHTAARRAVEQAYARLEGLSEVRDMNPAEYREAWAWVHLMLRGRPEARNVLLQYVRELRTNPQPGPLRSRLVAVWPRPEEALAGHLAGLEQAHLASAQP